MLGRYNENSALQLKQTHQMPALSIFEYLFVLLPLHDSSCKWYFSSSFYSNKLKMLLILDLSIPKQKIWIHSLNLPLLESELHETCIGKFLAYCHNLLVVILLVACLADPSFHIAPRPVQLVPILLVSPLLASFPPYALSQRLLSGLNIKNGFLYALEKFHMPFYILTHDTCDLMG